MRRRIVFALAALAAVAAAAVPGARLRLARVPGDTTGGHGQAAEAGRMPAAPLVVEVVRQGRPVAGVEVRFAVVSEPPENRYQGRPASLTDTLVVTDAKGFAATRIRLGSTSGWYLVRASALEQEVVFWEKALPRRWYLVTGVGMLGGLCLFLFGLYYGSKGLRRLAGERLREALFALTKHRALGALVGVVVTVIFQSSSATITLLVGMASAGLLTLGQSLGVILGADIGTTVTVQILAFRLFDYALVVAVLGFILMNSGRRRRDVGQAVFGFGLVFYSLKVVLEAAAPLRDIKPVTDFVTAVAGLPGLALLVAVVITALFRSSAATIGIVVGLSFAGLARLETAIPFVLGANLGTTFNAIVASWRGPAEARRIAVGHVLFKAIVVALALPFLPLLARLFAVTARDVPRQIANAHTLINVAAALLFLPVLAPLQKLLVKLVPDRAGKLGPRYLDPTALDAPELAVAQVTREVLRMGDKVLGMYRAALGVFLSGDKEGRRRVVAADDEVDRLEESITAFLASVPQEGAGPEASRRVMALFYITDELEHVADIVSKNLMRYAGRKMDENLAFSEEGLEEIRVYHGEVGQRLETALAAVATWDAALAERLVRDREWGVDRKRELHDRHLERLGRGLKESRDTSTIHLDLISDLERVNFHCSQVGAAVARHRG